MSEEGQLDPSFLTVLQVQAANRTTFAVRGLLRYFVHTARVASVEPSPEMLYFGPSFPR